MGDTNTSLTLVPSPLPHLCEQAAYGRQALALSSFFTYVGLGLGLLGSSLALPFGLYVIICQRTAEKFIQVCGMVGVGRGGRYGGQGAECGGAGPDGQ